MTNAIGYELEKSIKRHIDNIWRGDTFDDSGVQTQTSECPVELRELFTYVDKNGVTRVFGPARVALGRIQDDIINLPNNSAIPSGYIEIYSNDPDSIEQWRDSMYSALDSSQGLDDQPIIMIGGANRYNRRMVVKMTIFYIESDQLNEEVSRIGHACSSFLISLLKSYAGEDSQWAWNLDDEFGERIVDPFGERPWRSYPVISHSRRRGGTPDDYIWDIKIYLEVATFQE